MAPVVSTDAGFIFVGSVDSAEDVAQAAVIAATCSGYVRDEDDECYIETEDPTCFNCRARRWTPDGFTCMRGLLHP